MTKFNCDIFTPPIFKSCDSHEENVNYSREKHLCKECVFLTMRDIYFLRMSILNGEVTQLIALQNTLDTADKFLTSTCELAGEQYRIRTYWIKYQNLMEFCSKVKE